MSENCPPSTSSYPSDCEITEGLRTMARNRSPQPVDETVLAKAKEVKLLLLDVDGVLTDGTLVFSNDGTESKAFNTQDGFGIRLLQEAGIDVGVITARKSTAVSKRAENLKMRYVYQGESNKLTAYYAILKDSGLKPVEIAYMGDDWLDLILLKRVGFAAAPCNGVAEVKEIAHYTTVQGGGNGAVREICDLILRSKGLHQTLLKSYMNR
jgi:3-deoxy-D-manno-octulosonate 8-phosphate phosphatase (KDO 8-P phosphatase)